MSFVAHNAIKDHDKAVIHLDPPLPGLKGLNLLKGAVLYGANASGKGNLLHALQALKRTLTGTLGADESLEDVLLVLVLFQRINPSNRIRILQRNPPHIRLHLFRKELDTPIGSKFSKIVWCLSGLTHIRRDCGNGGF